MRTGSRILVWTAAILAAGCATPPPATPTTQPAPSVASCRPAAFVEIIPTSDPAAESKVELSEAAGKLVGTNLRLADLVCLACRTADVTRSRIPLLSAVRVISDRPLPQQRYDVCVQLAGVGSQELRAALRKRLETQFGLKLRNEWRQTDALVLREAAGSAPAGLPPHQTTQASRRHISLSGSDYLLLAEQLEERLSKPVVNETDLRGPYEVRLEEPLTVEPDQRLSLTLVQQALRGQLGLELVPGRRVVEFVVVEWNGRGPTGPEGSGD